MTADWKRALQLYEQSVDLPEQARATLLDDLARESPALAKQLRSLLEASLGGDRDVVGAHMQAALSRPLDEGSDDVGGFLTGRQIGPYQLIKAIGRGGMASVWLAERIDGTLRRTFALKLPQLASRKGFVERFARERDILARLRHPHIARLHDAGSDADGQPYLALDYIEGDPITRWCDERRTPLRERLILFCQVLEAVQFAHANLIIHRDLKPSNILVDADANVSLLDFGIAKLLDDPGSSVADTALTQAGGRMLTLQYASPEQIRGEALTIATDIYSLGVVLHELLAGNRPYRLAFDSAGQLEQAIAEAARESLQRSASDEHAATLGLRNARAMRRVLSGDLDAIVGKAMMAATSDRYPTVQMLHDDVRRYLDGHPVRARHPSPLRTIVRFVRRHSVASSMVGGLVAAVLAFATIAALTAQRERAQRERAEAVRGFLVGVFSQASPDENKGQPFTALQLLERGERQLAEQGDVSAATAADLTAVIGDLYWSIGEMARAAPLLEKAIPASRDPRVPDDVKARALLGLANMQTEKRAFDDALGNLDAARGFATSHGASASGIAADARRLRADVLVRRGDFAQAEPLLRDVLASDSAQFGDRSAAVATDWRLLATSLEELSRYDESAAAFRTSIDISRAVHGDLHSSVAYALNDLGLMLMHRGDLAGAEPALREALTIAGKLYGENTRGFWAVQSNLLRVIELEGRFGEALLARIAMLGKERVTLAETTPETLAFHTNFLGLDYRELGHLEEAEARFREALAMWQAIHGNSATPDSAPALMNLGVTLALRGRYADAEVAMRESLAIRAQHETEGSLPLNQGRGELGNLLRLQGRSKEAVTEQAKAVAAFSASLQVAGDGGHPVLAALLAQLSESQLDDGDTSLADATANAGLAMARRLLPERNLRLGGNLFAVARIKLALGQPASAESLLREALDVRSATYPALDPRVLEVKAGLLAALEALQRTAEAAALRAEIEPVLATMTSAYARTLHERMRVP